MARPTATIDVHFPADRAPHGTRFHEHPESWDDRKEHYDMGAIVKVDLVPLEGKDGEIPSDTDVLEVVFDALQNGRSHEAVSEFRSDDFQRSLSVGDVLIWNGDPFEVGRYGFNRITREQRSGVPIGSQLS